MTLTRNLLRLSAAGAALALAGCITLLPDAKPAQLYRFTPETAPLAAATPGCLNKGQQDTISALTVTRSIKRTAVNGGSRIVQTITAKNTATTAATGLWLATPYDATNTLLKGTAKPPGSSAVALKQFAGPPNVVSSGYTALITIPAGKTLKATIVFKAPNCIVGAATTATYAFGPAAVGYSTLCYASSGANPVQVGGGGLLQFTPSLTSIIHHSFTPTWKSR